MKKKVCLACALSLFAIVANAATFEWSFAVSNSQSGVAPVNVTAYLYMSDFGIWVGDGTFNPVTLVLTDGVFGDEYSPMGYPVTALSMQVSPVSDTLSKLTITWSTDPKLDRPTSSAMNQHWVIVFVDDATPDYFGTIDVRFRDDFSSSRPYAQRDDFYTSWAFDLGKFKAVPEPSTVLLALVGISALCLRRRRVA